MFWAELLRHYSWRICWFSRNLTTKVEYTNIIYSECFRKCVIIAMMYSAVKLIYIFYSFIKMIEYIYRIVIQHKCIILFLGSRPLSCSLNRNFYLSRKIQFIKKKLVFIFETEKDRAWGWRGRKRGRHRIQSSLQVLSCQDRAQCEARSDEP